MKIIALETSAQPGSIAALHDGQLVVRPLPAEKKTAESFAVEMSDLLQSVKWHPSDVDVIAVCQGPGSFTGLRIGVTAAKTFAYVTGAVVVAENTLSLLAYQSNVPPGQEVWSLLDAQRNELYAALFRREENQFVELRPTSVLTRTQWFDLVEPHQWVTGTGMSKLNSELSPRNLIDKRFWVPDASKLAELAVKRVNQGRVADAWSLRPTYYRKSAAEEKFDRDSNSGSPK